VDVSIAIVSWNTLGLLDRCLESLRAGDGDLQTEIIVVDNASTDGSVEMVRAKYPEATLVVNTDNVGFAKANNQAYRISTGKYLLLLNSDTIVFPNAIRVLYDWMERHQDCGVCGPMLLDEDGSLQASWAQLPTLWTEARGYHDRNVDTKDLYRLDIETLHSMDGLEVGWVGGACMMVRREVCTEAGVLDDGFFMYCEETELCWRARNSQWKVHYVPGAEVTHIGGGSSRLVPARTRFRSDWSKVRLFWRMGGAHRASCLPLAVVLAIKTCARLIQGSARPFSASKTIGEHDGD